MNERLSRADLPHRGANTHNERKAAEYILSRFREVIPDAYLDDFYSIDTSFYLLASFYGEFVFVSALAHWFPRVFFAYGALVFILYLGEITGYPTLSRLLPHYETQNVYARLPDASARQTIVITACYDSPRDTPLAWAETQKWLPTIHFVLVCAMFLVLASCAVQAAGVFDDAPFRPEYLVRWLAAAILLVAAGASIYFELNAEQTCGANDNASGTAALLLLAESLSRSPLPEYAVWFAATGSKHSWMNGVRRLLDVHDFDRASTRFLNLERVGRGELCYATAEGILRLFRADPALVGKAAVHAARFDAKPCRLRGWPTDAAVILARGYKAMTITAVETDTAAAKRNRQTEGPTVVDPELIVRAAQFAEAVVRDCAGEIEA